jgi:acetyl-CoA synthetase
LLLGKRHPEETVANETLEERVFDVPAEFQKTAWISSMEQYQEMYRRSLEDADAFWAEQAEKRLHWFKKWDTVQNHDFPKAKIRWFEGGKLNVAYNCLDRHLDGPNADKVAYYFEGDSPDVTRTITYRQLWEEVTRFANVLKKKGVKKGDRVVIYLPMIPELPVAMLACARIGAIHCVVFGGFSAGALRDRILNAGATLITADTGLPRRPAYPAEDGGRRRPGGVPQRQALASWSSIPAPRWVEGRDVWWQEELAAPDITTDCPCEVMDAEDPLFILYTSGSTGKPKGVVHTTAGYLLYVAMTHKLDLRLHDDDIYWCTADIGWVTGHTYIVYGPLCQRATSVMFEGVPTYPEPDRFWQSWRSTRSPSSTPPHGHPALIARGTTGPRSTTSPACACWARWASPSTPRPGSGTTIIGGAVAPSWTPGGRPRPAASSSPRCPGARVLKPGSASRPFFGVEPVVLRDDGTECAPNEGGKLCIKKPWPGMMRTVWGDHERFIDTYFTMYPGTSTSPATAAAWTRTATTG